MLNTLILLSQRHSTALRSMVQESLKPGVSVSSLNMANPVALPDGQMRIGVYLTPEAYHDPNWLYRGQSEFTYRRMSFQEFFQGIPLVLVTVPQIRTRNLVNMLERIFHIHIADDDFFDEAIDHNGTPLTYRLRATPSSQRWYGYVDVTVTPVPPPVGIPDPNLDGLAYTINELLTVSSLDHIYP